MKNLILSVAFALTAIAGFASGHTAIITVNQMVTCNGMCDASLTASASGGVGPFSYQWSNGSTTPAQTALCAGSYTVEVTDNSDLSTATASVVVTEPLPISIFVSGDTVCSGSCTTLNPIVTGGTPGYSFNWTGGVMTSAFTACPSGASTYTVLVTDVNGCTASAVAAVEVNMAAFSYPSSTYCITAPPVTPVITGMPGGVFSGTGITNATTGQLDPAVAGPGTFTISYAVSGACTDTAYATLTIVPLPAITLPSSYDMCAGSAVCFSASVSGSGPFTYSWVPIMGLSSSSIINPCATPLASTSYSVLVSDGLCSSTATTFVNVDVITATVTSTNASACNTSDGSITIVPVGGIPSYYYTILPGGGSTPTAVGLPIGTYMVSVTDAIGCTDSTLATIGADNAPAANFTVVPDSSNAFNFFIFNSSTGPDLRYSWDWGDATPLDTTANPSHFYSGTGMMNVCLNLTSSTCPFTDMLCRSVAVTGTSGSCLALFNIADDTTTADPNALYVYNLSYGATLSYLWDFGDGTTSTLMTPSHTYSSTGPFTLCLSVDNGSGCTDMFCDTLTTVDSLNRSAGLTIQVFDVPQLSAGIAESSAMEQVSISPNPFRESTAFTMHSKRNETYLFELTDVLGKKVKKMNNITTKQFSISREDLENGIYFYKISSPEGVVNTGKLIIQ
ncbi:MAG: PKD domain-containing protein [Bacteroidia bacterium]